MNKIKFTAATVAVAMLAGTTWFYARADGKETPAYRTAPVTRATLTSTVSATGALSAVRTVQVGTQVSGQVAKIYVDFNDKVKKGQLLAHDRSDAAAAGRPGRAGAAGTRAGAAESRAGRVHAQQDAVRRTRHHGERVRDVRSRTSACSRRR